MSESAKNLLNIDNLFEELCNSKNFLNFKWDNYSVPIIDVDFFDLFSRLVINNEVFKFSYELSKEEIEKIVSSGEINNREELEKLNKARLRIEELEFEDYLSQNTLAIFKNPKFYINRLNETVLHTPLNNHDLNNNLNLINLKNKKILNENGLPNLYLTFGFYTADEFNAPLIFIPVKLEKNDETFNLSYDSHDKIRLNTSLELKLKKNNIALPQKEIESESDMISYLTDVNKLGAISSFITLGLFDFTVALTYNDLKKFNENSDFNNLLKSSDKKFQFNESEIDLIDENNSYNVLDADSSQISAIREALLSSDLFIDAPEGSKKLDTIVNLISEIIANKKTVLLVSDKVNEIHEIEELLSNIGLEKTYIDLYGDNYNYKSFIKEIRTTSEHAPKFEFDKNYTDSKLDELNNLKIKLADYSTFINAPYKKTGLTPYNLIGMIEKEYDDEVNEFEMKNLSNLTNKEYMKINQKFIGLSDFYVNKIHPVAEHKFNYIVAKDLTDNQVADIVNNIPILKDSLEELIKLNNEINEEFGIKKLDKLNDYKNHFKKLEAIENNPQLMGDDYNDLKKYAQTLNSFQTKIKEYDSIEELEKILLVEVYNTRLDLEKPLKELIDLNDELIQLNNLFDEFKSKISDAGIKKLNSINEVESVKEPIELLDKNPSIISDENKLDSFVEDLNKYQSECETNSPEDLLKNIDNYSKLALTSTIEKINALIGYQKSIKDINMNIDELDALRTEIGLNEFRSINNLKENLKKSDILLSCPISVEDEDAIDEFIDIFKLAKNKFGNTEYDIAYSKMNDELDEIQNNISDEISKTSILETTIPTIKNEIITIADSVDKLSGLLNIKQIESVKEVDEYCDNIEILLKNPIIIPSNEKSQINAYIALLEDIQNEKNYTKLDLDEVNNLIAEISIFDKTVQDMRFENSVFNLNLKECSNTLSLHEAKLYSLPIDSPLSPDDLNNKFAEFTKEFNKLFKNPFGGNYKKLKDELKSYYKYEGPKDDDTLYADYKDYVEIINDIEDVKEEVFQHNNTYNSMETKRFKDMLKKLVNLGDDYHHLRDEYHRLVDRSDFDDALKTLVPIKLRLIDINEISGVDNSHLTFKKGIGSKKANVNSTLKKYFPNTYFNAETNLDDLYHEYIVNEEYGKLVENDFFSNDSLDKYNSNKNEIKSLLNAIKQSKSKIHYHINLIGNNIEINETSLDLVSIYNKPFFDLKNYFYDLSREIKKANDLFNNVNENYKVDDIEELIDNYSKLNKLDNIKEFVTTNSYLDSLLEYKNDFILLGKFNSMSEEYSSLINKYFQNVWKDKETSFKDLNDTFENHKNFTKLFNEGFFSQNIFKFLENSEDEIKSKIADLNSNCNNILELTGNSDDQLIFHESNFEEIDFEEYKNQNNEILRTLELLRCYNPIYSCYDENKLIYFDEKADFSSLDLVDQLYKDLAKLYSDSKVLKYNISFEDQIKNLDQITENKKKFINLVRLRNSIEDQTDLIENHFGKLWDGANTDISIIENKVSIDKSFTKSYNEGIFSDLTVELINGDEHAFANYKSELTSLFDEIKNQINNVSSNPIITNEIGSELTSSEFEVISQKTSDIKKDINGLNSNYDNINISKSFKLNEITSDIEIMDGIIQSKYINYINNDLTNLNKANENLKTILNNHNELQSIKDDFDNISVDTKYFKDIDNGYDTSVSDLNKQLEYNKKYEDLFNEGFFSSKTDNIIKDESKLDALRELISKMETNVQNSINLFETLDLIHPEKGINVKKALDEELNYVTFLDDNINQLKDWIDFERLSKDIDNEVCHEFINAFYNDDIKPELINKTFTYNFARNLFNEIKETKTFISNEDIDKYCELDKEVIKLNRSRVINEYIASKPDIKNIGNDSKSMKQYRAFNKFNDLTMGDNGNIKEILELSLDYIKAIKPIFITTPTSVFKYLSSGDFDYVIYNDVNQIPSEMAITSLLRADKKIVIGDSKQSNIGIISLIKDKFKTKQLKWCYTTKNTSFCSDEILIYPKQNQESSFEIINVDNSVYDISSQINELEAARIVDLAIDHVIEYGFDKTLGIIAFTKAQRDYIIKLLVKKLEDSPDLVQYFNPLDSFYVKYIDDAYESRDFILASLTYGFDVDNVLNTEFESENEYVINKLMTKSFEKTIVLTNFKRKDIVRGNNLKSLFEYQTINGSKEFEPSLFEKGIFSFLNDNCFDVKKQLVDFTVNNNTSIECEGENFNKFENVRDKFRLHKELLESLGWKSLHVCTGEWIENKTIYQNMLLDAINEDTEFEINEDISFDEDLEFDFENEEEITINEIKELL